ISGYAPFALGHPIPVGFRLHEARKTRHQMVLFVAPPANDAPVTRPLPASTPPAPLNERYTFDHFVVAKSNARAYAASRAVPPAPGRFYNPLFIYGDTGLGKTHLMQAVAHEIQLLRPESRIALVGTEQFTNDLVTAIQSRTQQEFKRRYW